MESKPTPFWRNNNISRVHINVNEALLACPTEHILLTELLRDRNNIDGGPSRIWSSQNSIMVFLCVIPRTNGPGNEWSKRLVESFGANFHTFITFVMPLDAYFGFTQTIKPFAKDAIEWSLVNLHGVDRCGSWVVDAPSIRFNDALNWSDLGKQWKKL